MGFARRALKKSTAFFRPLAGVLFAASRGAALQADFLATAGGGGKAIRWHRLGGADVGFDSDFFRHEELRVKKNECCILSHTGTAQSAAQLCTKQAPLRARMFP